MKVPGIGFYSTNVPFDCAYPLTDDLVKETRDILGWNGRVGVPCNRCRAAEHQQDWRCVE